MYIKQTPIEKSFTVYKGHEEECHSISQSIRDLIRQNTIDYWLMSFRQVKSNCRKWDYIVDIDLSKRDLPANGRPRKER
jgi:hypothetical protein